jgi:hypothetical protein
MYRSGSGKNIAITYFYRYYDDHDFSDYMNYHYIQSIKQFLYIRSFLPTFPFSSTFHSLSLSLSLSLHFDNCTNSRYRFNIKEITAYLGVHSRSRISKNVITAGIKSVKIYPKFDLYTFNHDIAVIELNKRIEYNNIIRPACIPKDSEFIRWYSGCNNAPLNNFFHYD